MKNHLIRQLGISHLNARSQRLTLGYFLQYVGILMTKKLTQKGILFSELAEDKRHHPLKLYQQSFSRQTRQHHLQTWISEFRDYLNQSS